MWTEKDDEKPEPGKWNIYTAETTLAEESKVRPPKKVDDIWPHWSEGVPITLRRKLGSGLIDYSQKMTMAAMQIADMNV